MQFGMDTASSPAPSVWVVAWWCSLLHKDNIILRDWKFWRVAADYIGVCKIRAMSRCGLECDRDTWATDQPSYDWGLGVAIMVTVMAACCLPPDCDFCQSSANTPPVKCSSSIETKISTETVRLFSSQGQDTAAIWNMQLIPREFFEPSTIKCDFNV